MINIIEHGQLVTELRELHTNVGGAIEVIDLLVEEGAEVLLNEWATNLFNMAVAIEVRACNLSRRNPNNTMPKEVPDADTARTTAEASDRPSRHDDGQEAEI